MEYARVRLRGRGSENIAPAMKRIAEVTAYTLSRLGFENGGNFPKRNWKEIGLRAAHAFRRKLLSVTGHHSGRFFSKIAHIPWL